MHKRDGSSRVRVVRSDGAALGAELRNGQADTSRTFSKPHDVADGLGDVLDVILHFEDEAVGQLRVRRSGVD